MNTSYIVLEANNLCIGYRNRKQTAVIHSQLDFTLRKGELTCLLGKNGAGKSTLLRTLAGTQPHLSGELKLNGKELYKFTEAERARNIGIVLTDRTQTGGLTVKELVALGRQPHTGFFGRLAKKDFHLINHAMQAVGIEHKADYYTAELSDGERQKAMIAKVLVQECPIILLDEPTAFLDIASRIEIMTLLHQLADTENKAILLSTHDIEQALMLSDRLWLLSESKGLQTGITEDLVLNGQLNELFNNDNIQFDTFSGSYIPTNRTKRHICLETDSDILSRWARNALARIGIEAVAARNNVMDTKLIVQDKNHLCWILSDTDIRNFHSFEDFINDIKTWIAKYPL